ncbi:hypothetical protein ACJROX_09375 [Pseudalkalibacillus sp. A8]|uniref:hypothetical protein n=1 Tax=Pseudalkalibacillus sp. A8 TaxID=3382641 RepID=UPI0038B53F89
MFFERSPGQTNYTVAHYRPFLKVDCFYYRMKDLKPSVWMKDIKIAYDPAGMLKNCKNLSARHSYRMTEEEFFIWQGKLFAYFHEVYRRAMRDEESYVHTLIIGLKWLIAAGWYIEKGIQPNSFGDWSKIEGERSPLEAFQLKLLENWRIGSNASGNLETIRKMVPAARRVHRSLCMRINQPGQVHKIDEVLELIL